MTLLIQPSRRGFLLGLASTFAAPAIVRAGSLMSVRVPIVTRSFLPLGRMMTMENFWELIGKCYADMLFKDADFPNNTLVAKRFGRPV